MWIFFPTLLSYNNYCQLNLFALIHAWYCKIRIFFAYSMKLQQLLPIRFVCSDSCLVGVLQLSSSLTLSGHWNVYMVDDEDILYIWWCDIYRYSLQSWMNVFIPSFRSSHIFWLGIPQSRWKGQDIVLSSKEKGDRFHNRDHCLILYSKSICLLVAYSSHCRKHFSDDQKSI